jgi:hypothetical protein
MIALATVLAALAIAAPNLPGERAAHVAADIAAEAEDVEQGLALVTIARFESDFREEVENCAITGDDGEAISLFQMHVRWYQRHTRREICWSNRLATKLAAQAVSYLRRMVRTPELIFMRYVGTSDPRDRRIVSRLALYRRLVKEVSHADVES